MLEEKNRERKRLNGLIYQSPMKVYRGFRELGQQVFTEGALPQKQKFLTALAIAVSQNCFD